MTGAPEAGLHLGVNGAAEPVRLPPAALLRHVVALGSSGSGKTAFCKAVVEEAVLAGIPSLCLDPQGDLCSLAAGVLSDLELSSHGLDPTRARAFADAAEVVVFTPGSSRGLPMCADPVDPGLKDLEGEALTGAISRTAAVVVGLLGYDLDTDDGAGLLAVMDRALTDLVQSGARASLAGLTETLFAEEESGYRAYARYLEPRKIKSAGQRLARLDVGSRRLLFHDGLPMDIDVLLGLSGPAAVKPGKTRVAVVYLNSLHQQEDKEFVVATLADRLYRWMLARPSKAPQALFYLDEVAPFIPPVRKPACKDGLSLLFKQARKYGVACLTATQNPGDVDYKALGQFGTWALGRLATRQDRKKVEPSIRALAPEQADDIAERMPALTPGEMVLLSPDHFEAPVALKARWLFTHHETWDEDRIAAYVEPLRERFELVQPRDTIPEQARKTKAARAVDVETAEYAEKVAEAQRAPDLGDRLALGVPAPGDNEVFALEGTVVDHRVIGAPGSDEDTEPVLPPDRDAADTQPTPALLLPGEDTIPEPIPQEFRGPTTIGARDPREQHPVVQALAQLTSSTVKDLAQRMGKGEQSVRKALKAALETGAVRMYKEGRTHRYYAMSAGRRPDLGLGERVEAVRSHFSPEAIQQVARTYARRRVLGLLGEQEEVASVALVFRSVYRVGFEERVEAPLLNRLFGSGRADERIGNLYLHPRSLHVLSFGNESGIRFEETPNGPASEVRDLDGRVTLEPVPPTWLAIDEEDWTRRRSLPHVRKSFQDRFQATISEVEPVFLPIYDLRFRNQKGSVRRVEVDGLVGRPVSWSPPE